MEHREIIDNGQDSSIKLLIKFDVDGSTLYGQVLISKIKEEELIQEQFKMLS